jgi:hypothetical protein
MPKTIFTDNFLKPYLEIFRLSAMPDIQHKKAILQNWHESIAEGNFTKEEEAKSRFVNEIFGDVLGFNYKNPKSGKSKKEHKSVVGMNFSKQVTRLTSVFRRQFITTAG